MFNLRECNTRLLAEVAQLRHQVPLLGALPQEDACARQHEVSAQTQAKLPQEEAWGQQQGEQSPQPALQQRQVQQPPQKQQKSQHAQLQQQQQKMLLSQQGTSLSQQGAMLSQPGASQPQLVSPSLRPSQHTQGCLAKPIVKSVGVDAVSCEPIHKSVGVDAVSCEPIHKSVGVGVSRRKQSRDDKIREKLSWSSDDKLRAFDELCSCDDKIRAVDKLRWSREDKLRAFDLLTRFDLITRGHSAGAQ